MDKEYFDALMESLADAAAFAQGDTSRAKVVKADSAVYETSGVAQDNPPWESIGRMTFPATLREK